jgi:hypothetical protein
MAKATRVHSTPRKTASKIKPVQMAARSWAQLSIARKHDDRMSFDG